ncbi:MAG: hypothetical protein V1729_00045 [Candidatus Woesearchaeota archaeon]
MKEFEKEFLEFISDTFQRFGLDSLSSQMVSILFLEPDEVAMEDLATRTGYSLASVSTKMRPLEDIGLVKKMKRPGTKRSFYFMDKDVYSIMLRKLDAMERSYITPAKSILPNIIEKQKSGKISPEDKKKMDIIQNYHKQLTEVSEVFNRLKQELGKRGK